MSRTYEWYFVDRKLYGIVTSDPSSNALLKGNKVVPQSEGLETELKSLKSGGPSKGFFDSDHMLDNPGNATNPLPGNFGCIGVFLGVGLETLLLNNVFDTLTFRSIVQLYTADQARELESHTSTIKSHNYKDGARMEFFQAITFDLIPSLPSETMEPFGSRYHTGTVFNTSVNHDVVRAHLFNLRSGFADQVEIKYIIDKDTVKMKRLRKESPTF